MRDRPERKNESRLGKILEDYGPRLYRFLLFRLGSKEDALDIAQEAYLRLLRVERTKFIEKPDAYLFRIASNLAHEQSLHNRRAAQAIDMESLVEKGAEPESDSFEQHIEHRAALRHMEKILDTFPPIYRAILLMRKRDGMSRDEIADKLGISTHTVKKYLTRVTARCREEWVE